MGDSYKEGCLDAKRRREGIVDQREKSGAKKKKIKKPWEVYTRSSFPWFQTDERKKVYCDAKFATEEEAIKHVEKRCRVWNGLYKKDNYWIVNSENRRGNEV